MRGAANPGISLARNLVALRKARGMTQAQLSDTAGLSRNHYRLLETVADSGRQVDPRLSTIQALALALDVNVEDLLIAPSDHTVFRWAEAGRELDDRETAVVLDRLLRLSTAHLGERAAAFVGQDDGTVAMGVAVPASTGRVALILTDGAYDAALRRAGVRATLLADVEVTIGTDGLVGAEH